MEREELYCVTLQYEDDKIKFINYSPIYEPFGLKLSVYGFEGAKDAISIKMWENIASLFETVSANVVITTIKKNTLRADCANNHQC